MLCVHPHGQLHCTAQLPGLRHVAAHSAFRGLQRSRSSTYPEASLLSPACRHGSNPDGCGNHLRNSRRKATSPPLPSQPRPSTRPQAPGFFLKGAEETQLSPRTGHRQPLRKHPAPAIASPSEPTPLGSADSPSPPGPALPSPLGPPGLSGPAPRPLSAGAAQDSAPRCWGHGGAGRVQPAGGAGRLRSLRDGAAGGAAGALPARLAGAPPVPAEPGRRLLLHLQGRGGQGAADGGVLLRRAAGAVRVPAVHGAVRAGQRHGGPAQPVGPARLRVPHGAAAPPCPALAAALPGRAEDGRGGLPDVRDLHGLVQRLPGRLPPLGRPQGRHRGLLRAAAAQRLPGDHERGLGRGRRGRAGGGLAPHRRCLQHHPGAVRAAPAARPALGMLGSRGPTGAGWKRCLHGQAGSGSHSLSFPNVALVKLFRMPHFVRDEHASPGSRCMCLCWLCRKRNTVCLRDRIAWGGTGLKDALGPALQRVWV